ncbi:MAG: radical SAM protein [Candidatus Lernaella stagnicola]|nr:radical SAM protein [Candidatus Lernaella stagnicola]
MKSPFEILRRLPKFGGYLVKKPGFAYHAAGHVLREKWRGERLITAIEYGVTYKCQAKCEKCSALKMDDPTRPKLTDDQLRQLGDDCYRWGVYEANFTGGEPLVDKRLEDIISFFHPERTFIGINTNGALLDRRRIMTLRAAGADLFKISLDSPIAAEHDASRGIPGLFDHIFETLRIIQETPGVRGHLCMVTTREAVESGQVSQTLALAKKYDATLGMVFPSVTGGWSRQHEVMIEDTHRDKLRRIAEDPAVFFQGNVGKGEFRCPCGTREIYITCYGDIIPCPFIQIAFGNITDEPFDAIYRRMSGWDMLAKRDHMCHGAQDREFIEKYNDPLAGEDVLPIAYDRHPSGIDVKP